MASEAILPGAERSDHPNDVRLLLGDDVMLGTAEYFACREDFRPEFSSAGFFRVFATLAFSQPSSLFALLPFSCGYDAPDSSVVKLSRPFRPFAPFAFSQSVCCSPFS
jgi:hypothetical protein